MFDFGVKHFKGVLGVPKMWMDLIEQQERFFSGCLKVPLNPNCIFAFVMVKTDFKNRLLIVI